MGARVKQEQASTSAATERVKASINEGERELLEAENEHLRALLAELLRHDVNRFGPWTMGMRDRVRKAIGATDDTE